MPVSLRRFRLHARAALKLSLWPWIYSFQPRSCQGSNELRLTATTVVRNFLSADYYRRGCWPFSAEFTRKFSRFYPLGCKESDYRTTVAYTVSL